MGAGTIAAAAVLLIPLGTAGLLQVAPRRTIANLVAVGGAVGLLAAVLVVMHRVLNGGAITWGDGILRLDDLSALLLFVLGVVGFSAVVYSVDYLGREGSPRALPLRRLRRYHGFVMLFLFSMLLVGSTNNLGVLWIALEGTTLVSAILVGYYHTPSAIEASWKYLILCSVGLVLALLGTLFLDLASLRAGASAGSALNWTTLIGEAPHLDPGLVRLACVFLFLGYGTKAGWVPLHTWLPDAHSEAPAPVSALLSGALLNCAVYALLRLDGVTLRMPGFGFAGWLFLGFGLLSVTVAALFILVQRDLKRLLAYSSVENMGIIAIGVGVGGALGLLGALFQMLNHAMTKATLFLVGGSLTLVTGTKEISEMQGALTGAPTLGALLLVGGLALAGVPPFSLFASEYLIVTASFGAGQYVVAGVLLGALAVAFAGLMVRFSRIVLGSPGYCSFAPRAWQALASGVAISVTLLLALGLGLVLPGPLAALLQGAVHVVNG
ncbi:MAG: proton-conducting transporter transmembrane domain-containing protein [Thermoplasmata archaeon]